MSANLQEASSPAIDRDHSLGRSSLRSQLRLFRVGVLVLGLVYVAGFMDRGWIPSDDGMFGLTAESALHGKLPHRDFVDYTGGMTWLHAMAFKLAGIRLSTLRWVLLLFVLPFEAAVFSIASRFARPLLAAVITLFTLVWSVPNIPTPYPSWYNLFLATFGILFLFKHVETGRKGWIFAAGVCSGVSILMKIIGLYDVAAVLLFLAYREQVSSAASSEARPRFRVFFLVKAVGFAAFLGLLLHLFRTGLDLPDLIHFFLPTAAVWAVLLILEWREGRGAVKERIRELWQLLLPFGLGVLLPICLFLVPFARQGALKDLYHGVIFIALVQVGKVRLAFPPLETLKSAIPYTLLLLFPGLVPSRWRRWVIGPLCLLLILGILASSSVRVYESIWNSARSLDVAAVLAGCGLLLKRDLPLSSIQRQQLYLLISVCALLALVQFPFAPPFYFLFVAPVAALAIYAVVSLDPRSPKWIHASVLGFYLLFGMVRLNAGYAVMFPDYRADGVLALARGGLRIPAVEATAYESVVGIIDEHGRGRPLFAGPDCPEVYFLSGRPNPTRFFFDFHGGLSGNPDGLERLLEEERIGIAVVNRSPPVSERLAPSTLQALAVRYPHSVPVFKFLILWKD